MVAFDSIEWGNGEFKTVLLHGLGLRMNLSGPILDFLLVFLGSKPKNIHQITLVPDIGADSASAASCRTRVIQYVVLHVPPLLRGIEISFKEKKYQIS
jgi:hypothetical protein